MAHGRLKDYGFIIDATYGKMSDQRGRYEKYLEPVTPLLEPYLREFGYDQA